MPGSPDGVRKAGCGPHDHLAGLIETIALIAICLTVGKIVAHFWLALLLNCRPSSVYCLLADSEQRSVNDGLLPRL